MSVPIYIKSKVATDDVYCIKSQEMLEAVDSSIAKAKSNPAAAYQSLHLDRADKFDMRVVFYGSHPYAYVYVSAADGYQAADSRPFDVSNGCGALRDHVAGVLSAHKQ